MRCAILGSGPSLERFLQTNKEYKAIIGCNSLVSETWFRKAKEAIYIAHERRLINRQFFTYLERFEKKIYFSKDLLSEIKKNFIEFKNLKKIMSFDTVVQKNIDVKKYKKISTTVSDLNKNVILDYSIPLALHLGYKEIDLYGCDFTYGSSAEPSYYHEGGTIGNFVHSKVSAKEWSGESLARYKKVEVFLKTLDIKISRILG